MNFLLVAAGGVAVSRAVSAAQKLRYIFALFDLDSSEDLDEHQFAMCTKCLSPARALPHEAWQTRTQHTEVHKPAAYLQRRPRRGDHLRGRRLLRLSVVRRATRGGGFSSFGFVGLRSGRGSEARGQVGRWAHAVFHSGVHHVRQ